MRPATKPGHYNQSLDEIDDPREAPNTRLALYDQNAPLRIVPSLFGMKAAIAQLATVAYGNGEFGSGAQLTTCRRTV
ncbi:MAG TPA: hypothetical protein VHZ07_04355 [Bryobacteraceae bacterium]|jgi:hypothetical protein|nr:hypothetical protein [Bryobacteraceae bacterium]